MHEKMISIFVLITSPLNESHKFKLLPEYLTTNDFQRIPISYDGFSSPLKSTTWAKSLNACMVFDDFMQMTFHQLSFAAFTIR